jgi:hypothetical protein
MSKEAKETQDLTSFALDLTKIMDDPEVLENFDLIPKQTQDFLMETYNPALAELERLYKKNPSLTLLDEEVLNLAKDLNSQLGGLKVGDSGSNSDIKGHLNFVLDGLINKRTLSEIIDGKNGLATRLAEQVITDFSRTKIKVADEVGEIIIADLTKKITDELDGNINLENISQKLVETLNLSDKQLNFVLSRVLNQRSIDSAGLAFVGTLLKDRQNIFHIEGRDGKSYLKSVEHSATSQTIEHKEDGDIAKIDLAKIIYNADLSQLSDHPEFNKQFLVFPTLFAPEIITYQSLCPEGNIILEGCLQHRKSDKVDSKDKLEYEFPDRDSDDDYAFPDAQSSEFDQKSYSSKFKNKGKSKEEVLKILDSSATYVEKVGAQRKENKEQAR